ncbi:KUP/HAK/KT family potassium transporter [Clostridium saccharobutylicum]|uniref:Probable potassium transport system protein Kup n=1 Tax=Clostridium saccharobutylicum DSM 13864 TaxID=1345695 RepID=U5MX40_CLOSA|nr:KUP/HAK/KT family potassium transporter [Clostridium saccharobutylicum]AGX44196.1 potassium transport system protein Kup [Clostridium saccharobutylicum DSM 13864]AQR91483.1 Low affinity potassium transport system protein kup [Clostridium saccharobutylicum]AQS01388.1 Low affinity potassium transport system protein kup [Clostridium saccharobutylicum]AQS10995.1 Low affinity potassium transport system protein kup [Clostridium saccharobutylicum]AQS15371.1 Low affinity potassium transport system 
MKSTNKHTDVTKFSAAGLLVALGVVYGDIGTSPLYAMKSFINGNGGLEHVSDDFILGSLSLVFWTITLLTTVKYVLITLKADNNGEGGIFSLFTLVRNRAKWLIIPAMLGGSALLADGMLTPAVSITSAVEGLELIPSFNILFGNNQNIIITIVIAILFFLFFIQHFGTDLIGKVFGPIMLIWFCTLAFFGIINLSHDWTLLRALSPYYAVNTLFSSENKAGLFILGSAFLSSTGAEALYSDLGHVGKNNIYGSWPFVKICLILNYFGQGAWLLSAKNNPSFFGIKDLNPFFQMIPPALLIFGIIISTLATIIASQALISGSFTLVSEAIKLNLFPRLHTMYPSSTKGQLYLPAVNRILAIACIGIVLYFQSSQHMEAAYGLSITVTMLMTTILLFNYLLKNKTPFPIALLMLIFFGTIEFCFFIANIVKFMHGGFVAVLIALAILFIMYIWIKGHYIKMGLLENVSINDYKNQLNQLRLDTDRDKYTTNLVCLTNCEEPDQIERKIMYSILDKRPKRADVYWFVNIKVTDEPYDAEYTVDTLDTLYIVKVQIRLGFRVEQKLNVFLRQISTELVENGEIKNQSRSYTILPDRKVGDFRFILIQEQLSYETTLNSWDEFILRSKLFIKRFTVSPAKWFGLETSDVDIENVPLFLNYQCHTTLKRTEK